MVEGSRRPPSCHRAKGSVFPRPQGWIIDGKEHSLDTLSIRRFTTIFTRRRFVSPITDPVGCCLKWDHKCVHQMGGFAPNWKKTWAITSWYATPRDQMAWLKLQHRTLYVAQREAPPLNVCRACGEEEKQQHLVECDVIYQGFWKDLIEMAEAAGMPTPNDIPTFLLSGDLGKDSRGRDRTVSNDHSGIFFIGWRCIYAAIVNSRIEDTLLKDETALKRAVSMIISRIRAAAGSLRSNIEASRNQRRPKVIGRKRRDRKVMTQSADGSYTIHPALLQLADRLGLDYTDGTQQGAA